MIGIRADANEHIASGHVMRCLSIADALFSLNEDVVFFTSDDFAREIIERRGYKVICLNSDWKDKDGELDLLLPQIEKHCLKLLLVDSYQVTQHYLAELHKIVKLAYLDDLNTFDYPVDIVINYSIYAEELDYPPNKTYLLGMTYVPLRKQFDISDEVLEKAIVNRRKNKQILITTGASDPYQVAEKVVRGILIQPELSEYRIAVVRGKFWNKDEFDIERFDYLDKNASGRISIYEDVENMAELMIKSYLAVSAGGSTLYELCACCVPTVTFSYADNQLGNVNGFANRGIMEYAGDSRYCINLEECIVNIILKYVKNNDIIIAKLMGLCKEMTLSCKRLAKDLITYCSVD